MFKMTTFEKEYQSKLVSADQAAAVIKSGDFVDYGWCAATTDAVDAALAKRMPELKDVKLRGGILLKEPEVFKIDKPEEHFTWNSWHMTGIERKAAAKGFAFYAPIRYSELPRYYRDGGAKVDVAVLQVAPMDEKGFFNFGVSPSHMMAVCEMAKTVIVEVNEKMPVCYGGMENCIHISQVDMIVEGNNPDIAVLPGPTPSEVDMKVAKLIVEELSDGCCVQLGIGAMPTAVGSLIAKSDLKDFIVVIFDADVIVTSIEAVDSLLSVVKMVGVCDESSEVVEDEDSAGSLVTSDVVCGSSVVELLLSAGLVR